ncbi:hypothetical+protein [Methylocapsa aurea]
MRLPCKRGDDVRRMGREAEPAREMRDANFVEIGKVFGYLRNVRCREQFPSPVGACPRHRVQF